MLLHKRIKQEYAKVRVSFHLPQIWTCLMSKSFIMFHTSDDFWDYVKRSFALIEAINIAMHNLHKCNEAMLLETSVFNSMRKGYFK